MAAARAETRMAETAPTIEPAPTAETPRARSPRFHHGRVATVDAFHRAADQTTSPLDRAKAWHDLNQSAVPKLEGELKLLLKPVATEETLEPIGPFMTTKEAVEAVLGPSKTRDLDTDTQDIRQLLLHPRLVALLAPSVLLAACCIGGTTPKPEATSSITASTPSSPDATETPVVTASPTEVPTIAPDGFTQGLDGKITWKGTNEKGVEVDLGVPDLSKYGLKAKLETDGTVIYVDAKSVRAGEFNPYVTEQQADGSEQQTGAVDLIPSFVSKIMQDKINSIPNQADKWIIPIPLSGATKESNVKIKYVKNPLDVTLAEIDFSNGTLSLTNPLLKSEQVFVSRNSVYGLSLFDYYRHLSMDNLTTIKPGEEAHYVSVDGNFNGFAPTPKLTKVFGDKICDTDSPIYLTYATSTAFTPVGKDKILHVAPDASIPSAPQVPVFLNEALAA